MFAAFWQLIGLATNLVKYSSDLWPDNGVCAFIEGKTRPCRNSLLLHYHIELACRKGKGGVHDSGRRFRELLHFFCNFGVNFVGIP